MISNYIFYLYTISNGERFEELFILFIFFILLLGICIFSYFFKFKNQKAH